MVVVAQRPDTHPGQPGQLIDGVAGGYRRHLAHGERVKSDVAWESREVTDTSAVEERVSCQMPGRWGYAFQTFYSRGIDDAGGWG